MTKSNQPVNDFYKMMDDAGLTGANLMDTKRSHSKIVNDIRTKLATLMRDEMLRREHNAYNTGYTQGTTDAQPH